MYEDSKAFLTCNHDVFTALCNPDRARAGDGGRSTPDHSRCHPACANISRTDSQITALRAEVARIDADTDTGLAPYPIAAREQQRKAHLTAIIRRHEAEQLADTDAEERR
ncbi:hypothetical protein QQY24_27760 [Streptomyces sp. TG1A-8]|uniref:hypothetical protein n=1 Tax=Streptomyces sp. TG1A-8 TaxID=3051385 RepID=UPI00265B987F|nr:hypothetical protein [Streptomyces sp. TG1A-8]MDO0929018.1 hypothetical protein [Streptomyces sp. TG1A-8]